VRGRNWSRALDAHLSGGAIIFLLAFTVRLLFALAAGNTYDFDEFVLLTLSRDFSHGATPYSGFMFFHPPGMLLILRAIEPATALWWPLARFLMLSLDSCTAFLVYRIATRLFSRECGVAAGILYSTSPLALVSAVRVGQDPVMTFLLAAGAAVLVESDTRWPAVGSGVCLALAAYIKYPAFAFLPMYLMLARRRAVFVAAGAVGAGVVLLAPFTPVIHPLLRQTVQFQSHRWKMAFDVRLESAALWWLAVNPFAVFSVTSKSPWWLRIGFLTGIVFLAASQVYYHYFVPVAPFAAVLGAPLAVKLARHFGGILSVGAILIGVAALWAIVLVSFGPSPLYVTAAQLSDVQPTLTTLKRETPSNGAVLSDQLEYQFLARRPALDDYFWNDGVLVNARYLEQQAPRASAVVMSYGASSGFPRGFKGWLDRRYTRIDLTTATVWLIRSSKQKR
jgi:hypothetical protein